MEPGRAFEWDDAKARSNLAKHGVPFVFAARVFLDPRTVDLDASREGDNETRRKAVDRKGVRRIISARRTNVTEQREYGPV